MPRTSKGILDFKTKEPAATEPDICKRFRKIRLHEELTLEEFAVAIKEDTSLIKQIEYGHQTPKIRVLRKVHNRFRVTYDWLIDGKLPMKK